MLVMVRRKPGLSFEEFRRGYEESHARIAVRLFGHLWREYRRNYLGQAFSFAAGAGSPGDEAHATGYDVVSELIFHDEAALAEMNRLAQEHRDELWADEERWFDRPNCWMVLCDAVEEPLSPRQGTAS
jgi:hypothetical protein